MNRRDPRRQIKAAIDRAARGDSHARDQNYLYAIVLHDHLFGEQDRFGFGMIVPVPEEMTRWVVEELRHIKGIVECHSEIETLPSLTRHRQYMLPMESISLVSHGLALTH